MEQIKGFSKRLNGHKKWFILAVIGILIVILLVWQGQGVKKIVTTFFGLSEKAVLKIVPSSGTYEIGSQFSVDVILDTNSNDVVAVSAYIEYDPTCIEVISIDTAGSEFTSSNECTSCKLQNHDASNGKIELVLAKPTPGVNGSNIKLATIMMKGKKDASTAIDFDFDSSYQGKSRVIIDDGQGTDILSGVDEAEIVFVAELASDPLRMTVDLEGDSAAYIIRIETKTFNADSRNSQFDISDVSPGSYEIEISAPLHLTKTMQNVSLPSVQLVTATLLAGNLYDDDNVINSLDFSIMNSQWGYTNRPEADINQDGIVNTVDFSFINKNWGKTSS